MPREREDRPYFELDRDVVAAYAATFVPRHDQYPLQINDGTYVAIKRSLHLDLVVAHLRGIITLGAYALSPESVAQWLCLDADTSEQWERLQNVSSSLKKRDAPSYLEPSRRGGHLWLFLPPVSGTDARRFGKQLAANYRVGKIEIYPKQDVLRTGPGSFVRLPLGKHRLTGRRYHFITPSGEPLAPTIREQIALLANPERVPDAYLEKVLSYVPKPREHSPTPAFKPEKSSRRGKRQRVAGTPSERIKAAISVHDFVRQYVELDARGRGYCPFHDDEHMSFGVSEDGNYWNCFAGCGGGSIIDFWMKWRNKNGADGSFRSALADLANRLLDR